jgi:hypothetical protein
VPSTNALNRCIAADCGVGRSARFAHDPDGHQWLLNRVELDNRKADRLEHLQSA